MSIKYRVKNDFKYDGKQYKTGDEWEPEGGKFDEQIITCGKYVYVEDERVSTRRDRRMRHKERQEQKNVDKEDLQTAIYAMRTQTPPMTWKKIVEITGVSITTARKYFEREKEIQDAENSPSGPDKGNRRKTSGGKG